MPLPARPLRFQFGRFELLLDERRLLDGGRVVTIGSRAFDLLAVLAGGAGQLHSKDELLRLVWPGLVVEEGNLQVQVSALRKILGSDAIETVPGYGYRFVAAVDASTGTAARRHNLPRQITSFVGRDDQVEEQRRRLETTRLLTITGSGGLGKSRFSIQLASSLVDQYADGVWLIELAAVADAANVSAAFAAVLGVGDARGMTMRDAVVGFVRDRHLLLVLDNCEHVIEPVAELAKAMLMVAPLVKLIATSREPLRLSGEALCPLSPLAIPPAESGNAAAAESPAVRLFVARARAAQPDFLLSSDNLPAVVSICRRLDGIPLAIELAAARMRASSAQTIAQRLDDALRFLTTGDRAALPRHQTLRAAIDWSYDYLAPVERTLMNRLSVFAGGFDLAAASAVHGADALDVLEKLVDKSLVVADPGGARYLLLEPLRQYAHDRLVEAGDETAGRDAHLGFFLALAERLEPVLLGPGQAVAYARLVRDRENLLAAHEWCARSGDRAQLELRLVCALRMFWNVQGPLHVGHRLATQALARASGLPRDYWHCQALFTAGLLAYFLGRHAEARGLAAACAQIARELGDLPKTSDVLVLQAAICNGEADFAGASASATEALAIAREAKDDMRIAQALSMQGEACAAAGDDAGALAAYEEALRPMKSLGERASLAGTLVNVARSATTLGRHAEAAARMLEAAVELRAGSARHQTCVFLAIAAAMLSERSQWVRAAATYGAFQWCAREQGFELERVDDAFTAPRIERARVALGQAGFALACQSGAAWPDPWSLDTPREWLAST